ncbi:hypothetical protein K491DRAFT_642581 [Lophiostoma macrostomum CBS 122681]|uniref:Zn(2)-C6 fungal-type domain-containing protein n=1 Tax=Lophiostoma macrostomum CBS 122681 TaxID=1314788 RepID=A0A6A6SQG1_9PLEO|nr:hypothetical protein K491DRAFT_642581 [Lophiostoma macrostomum CBS 122681]
MNDLRNLRKSCDLCYQRKIKCDRAKPRCSHCITYESDCTYAAPSRKSRPKKLPNCAKPDATADHTQNRLRTLEHLVQQLSETVKVSQQHGGAQEGLHMEGEGEVLPNSASQPITAPSDSIQTIQKHTVSLALPSLEHILPLFHDFLRGFNAALPMFHDDTLLRMLQNFYNVPYSQRDPVVWAAINIVMALAHRYELGSSSNTHLSVEYLNKAESVLSDIVLGDTQLINIQILVGMVLLLQASPDLTPSLILVATTMRLAHKIGLHDRTASAHLNAVDARQHAYVFWVAYILDKDLSMRSRQPSIQLDDDVDLELPSPEPFHCQLTEGLSHETGFGSGIIVTTDGSAEMNYFATRIQLAVIEGGVYDYLYSTRSKKRTIEERSHALDTISSALEAWKASIPMEFSARMASDAVSPTVLQLLAVMHCTSLACTTLINEANAWNAYWIEDIRRYATEGILPTRPPQWKTVVDEARQLTALLETLPPQNKWNFWTTGCSHMTAILLLTFNNMQEPKHDQLSLDYQLVERGLQMLDRVGEENQSEVVRSFHKTCAWLHRDAQRKRSGDTVMESSVDLPAWFVLS